MAFEDGMDYWVGFFSFSFWMGVMTGRGGRGGCLCVELKWCL